MLERDGAGAGAGVVQRGVKATGGVADCTGDGLERNGGIVRGAGWAGAGAGFAGESEIFNP